MSFISRAQRTPPSCDRCARVRPRQPITYQAEGAVVIAPPAGTAGVMLTGVHDLVLRGLTVRAAAGRGIWIDDASSILIDRATVANPAGVGIQIKRGTSVTITNSRLINNARAGLLDMSPAHGTTLRDSLVSANGHDGQRYNGDGVELNSSGAAVTGNTITHNGDGVGFEHGIYVGATANHYAITGNTIGANAGADVKAEGGPGLVAENRLNSGLFGVVLSDNPAAVTVQYNLIQGRFQHGVLLTTGATPARARLWNNTVRQTGRSTSSGNASAVFVASAAQLDLRNNLLSYTNPDALGAALMINDRSRVGSFVSLTNWYSSTDGSRRRLAWNGSRVTFGQWRDPLGSGRLEHRLAAARVRHQRSRRLAQHGRGPRHPPGPRARPRREPPSTRISNPISEPSSTSRGFLQTVACHPAHKRVPSRQCDSRPCFPRSSCSRFPGSRRPPTCTSTRPGPAAPTRRAPSSRATPRRPGARSRRRRAWRAPGDVVHVAAATYAAQFRPAASGTPAAPITYQADGAVTIAAPAGRGQRHARRRPRRRRCAA